MRKNFELKESAWRPSGSSKRGSQEKRERQKNKQPKRPKRQPDSRLKPKKTIVMQSDTT